MKRPVELLSVVGVAAVLIGTAGPALAYEAPPLDPSVDCPGPGIAVDEDWNPRGPAADLDLLPTGPAGSSDSARLASTVLDVTSNPAGPGGALRFVIGLGFSAASSVAPADVTVPCPLSAEDVSRVSNEVPTTVVGAELPKTGANVATVVTIGGGLVLAGAGVTALVRRRTSRT